MKSSLVNMVVVLLGITAVTSSAVGLVYRVTEAPIAQAKLHKKADALAQVLPPFDNTPADEMQAVAAGNDSVYVYTARMGQTVAGFRFRFRRPNPDNGRFRARRQDTEHTGVGTDGDSGSRGETRRGGQSCPGKSSRQKSGGGEDVRA